MPHTIPDISLVKIDLDSIDDADENRETVIFDVLLSGMPAPEWIQEFEYIYRVTPYVLKPPVIIEGDRLHVHFLPRYDDELQGFVDFLGDIACRATEEARRTISIKTTDEQEKRRADFRQFLKTIHVPDC